MSSLFDFEKSSWNIDWPGRVSRHDLVFLTPPEDPMQGLPIGNGEIGALVWFEPSKLIIVVNRSDLWDDASFGRFHNWHPAEEESSTTLRHGGRLIADFQLPVFDVMYLRDFKARLNLAEAAIEGAASGPFGAVDFHLFIDYASGMLSLELGSTLQEDVPLKIKVQRYGSRTFSHWYAQINGNSELGLPGTKALADQDGAYITHRLTSGTFAAGGRVVESNNLQIGYSIEDSHTAKMTVSGSSAKQLSVLAMITAPLPDDPLPALKEALSRAQNTGRPVLFDAHKAAWKAFWLRSLLEFGDDYLDNLWHLTLFYAACSQRGKYPGRFINGLWGWNRDVQNWNFYFHWNQQQIYWPLNAAGHHDLIESYLDYRFASLPFAREDARAGFDKEGAIVSDVSERRGYNSEGEFHNHTPVAQIALDFWRQYEYTGDREFLITKALPYLLEAASFFESLLEKESDGLYHAKAGTGYEGWILLHDCVSELVYARVLFATALEALQAAGAADPRAARWTDILNHLAPLKAVEVDPKFIEQGTFLRGWFKGDPATTDTLLAAGYGLQEQQWLTSFLPEAPAGKTEEELFELLSMKEGKPALPDSYRSDIRCNDGIFPWVEYAAVFPSGLISLEQRGTSLWDTAVNTVKSFACPGMGWSPLALALTWLGLGQEAHKVITSWPMYWQFYVNGWGQYGTLAARTAEAKLPDCISQQPIQDVSLPEAERIQRATASRMYPFRHMGMEAMSVLAAAMNEALLQSHEGFIRVAPAVTSDQRARFSLHARGGFVVSSEIETGVPLWLGIKSNLGATCRLANPWPKAFLYEDGRQVGSLTERILEFPTQAGCLYMLVPDEAVIETWETTSVLYARNENPKTHTSGYASLGLPKLY